MFQRAIDLIRPNGDYRRKILLWAAAVGFLCGAVEAGEPLDHVLRMTRNALRAHAPSGDIVVVLIDDKSLNKLGSWPWAQGNYADLIDRVDALGARQILIDVVIDDDGRNDGRLAASIDRSSAPVYLGSLFGYNPLTRERIEVAPSVIGSNRLKLANKNVWRGIFGHVWHLPYAGIIAGKKIPSFAAILGTQTGESEELFMIDHSIRLGEIPVLSAADVLATGAKRLGMTNKQVLIGVGNHQFEDDQDAPGHGLVPGVLLHAMGGETLKSGRPVELGWLAPLLFGLSMSATHLLASRRLVSRGALALGTMTLLFVPLILESRQVHVGVVPALLVLLIGTVARQWVRYRHRGVALNAVSGLPALDVLRDRESQIGVALVLGKIKNYAEIVASLSGDQEAALVKQIVDRFGLGTDGAVLHQGDNGSFAWLANYRPGVALGDELEGLHAILSAPIALSKRYVDLTIGFGVDQDATRTVASRLGSALIAAEDAATKGSRWELYDATKLDGSEWRLSLLGRLDQAIDDGEIWVAYQPKMDIATRRIVGAEALARWTHPDKGDIPPQDFVLAAEQNNRIEKLTFHILGQAIRAAATLNAHGIEFNVAVNLSARLLERVEIADRIHAMLRKAGLAPEHLTLEITESAAMSGHDIAMRVIERLGSLGMSISIDDYGTGFSTLEYLRDIPANEIKIDQRFVAGIDRSHSDRLMVNSTIQLAHSLGRSVVAEGVERPEMLEQLALMRCDQAQGFLVGRPMRFVALSRTILANREELVAGHG